MFLYPQRRSYKIKFKRRERDPDDPVWQGIVHISEVRRRAMRKALDEGTPYKDPYRHVLPPPPEENCF